jgi:uncharacterized protein (DUF1330 family)
MPFYYVANYTVTDPEGFSAYAELVPPITGASEATRIASGPGEVIEGSPGGRTVILSFPTRQAFHDWYDSDAYREVRPHRTDNSDGWALLIEGPELGA